MSYNVEEIKQQFAEVIKYSQGFKKVELEDLFATWERNKKDFIEFLNGELIYTYPEKQTFIMSEDDKASKFQSFKMLLLDDEYYCPALSDFLNAISYEEFYNNSLSKDYEENNRKVPKGMKVIKAFKHFIRHDERLLREIQDMASELVQQQEITGYVSISVHPLDYLSLSENAHNWTSCHNLLGDCRAGNLSYMSDVSTAIVYISDKKSEKITNFPIEWNSKKWRMLLHFSTDRTAIFAGRPYPFSVQSAKDFVVTHLLKKLNIAALISKGIKYKINLLGIDDYFWSPWNNNIISKVPYKVGGEDHYLAHRYIPLGEELIKLDDCVRNICSGEEALHYNDILFSSVYSPEWTYLKRKYIDNCTTEDTYFEIGNEVNCLACGKELITDASQMFCEECYDNWEICAICGEYIEPGKEIWLNDGIVAVCKHCYDYDIMKCEKCGNEVHRDALCFDEEKEMFICEKCARGEE